MSYLALYRKYRPYNFANVEGQDMIVKVLVNSIKNNHISHAYLFTGPRGTGKTSIAKIFARAVNCTNFTEDICDECDTCKLLKTNDSDIIEIDAASNNGVDEIRTLRDNVKLMPSFCKYKIYIIDEVHMLSTGAFNALLKTLEEPPSHVIFILATTEPQKIPLTILSRCQRFDFNRLNVPNIVHRLNHILSEEKLSLPDDIVDYIAKSSDGCLRDAVNLLDQTLSLNKGDNVTFDDIDNLSGKVSSEVLFDFLASLVNHNYSKIIEYSNSFSSTGKNLIDILDRLLTILRDISLNINIKNYFDKDYSSKLAKINVSRDKILDLSNLINNAINDIKYSNSQKILFDIYMLQISNSFEESTVEESTSDEEMQTVTENIAENKVETVEKPKIEQKIEESQEVNEEEKEVKEESVVEELSNPVSVAEEPSSEMSIKDIRINNCLATADKKCLIDFKEKLSSLDEFITNKKYIGIIDLLHDSDVVVASNDYLLFSFKDAGNVSIFDSNESKIESLFKQAFDHTYKVVCLSEDDWKIIKNEYIANKKNNISYTILDENVVKLNKKSKAEKPVDEASNIFGDGLVEFK